MKELNNYIQEKLNLSKYTCKPKDRDELIEIIKDRLDKDKDANLNDIDVSGITDMYDLFYTLEPHNIDISEWDVSNVTNMSYMFYGCENFNSDLSNWDVSNVEYMSYMFYYCKNFNSNLSEWDVSNVKYMKRMFSWCDLLKNTPKWYKK